MKLADAILLLIKYVINSKETSRVVTSGGDQGDFTLLSWSLDGRHRADAQPSQFRV